MNVANLDLCKEMYELSGGWGYRYHYPKDGEHDLTDKQWYSFEGKTTGSRWIDIYDRLENRDPHDDRRPTSVTHNIDFVCPAYDLGYLLDKILPEHWTLERSTIYSNKVLIAWLGEKDYHIAIKNNDSLSDIFARLAIELFKQGVLK